MEGEAYSSMNLLWFARKQCLNTPPLAIEKPLSGTSPLLSLYFFIKTRASPGITFSPVHTNSEHPHEERPPPSNTVPLKDTKGTRLNRAIIYSECMNAINKVCL